ncbi:glycosyltransferase [Dermatobacter hominis]|uniref:glycosyltransferase n=1 Tax=Dermatobacter hominis TaxID=2884263 RepID=UPI0021060154|nr:glycosyltransferase [Dermatobacter hominis]
MRVLQVLADTDDRDDGRAALDLHRSLTAAGVEIRTLALAPGRQAGLAGVVPTMSPSARSLAAHTQLRREQRWADVVVLRGEAPAAAAGLAPIRSAPPTVLALGSEAERWLDGPVPSRAARLVGRADAIVVTSEADAAVGSRWGIEPADVHVIPYGAPPVAVITAARRAAARRELGLAEHGLVAHLSGDETVLAAARAEADRLGIARTEVEPVDDRVVRFGDGEEPDRAELAVAAADLVVVVGGRAGPPPAALRAAGAGLAVVGRPDGAMAGLVDAGTGWTDLADAVAAGADEVARRGDGAAARVRDRYDLARLASTWEALLSSAADR